MTARRIVFFFFFLAIASVSFSQEVKLASLLPPPSSLSGWSFSREPECYAGDQLFDLIDGGADLFYEYEFKKVVNAQYSKENGGKIQVEVYEMGSDTSAFGIFSSIYNASDLGHDFGLYSVTHEQYIAFVKDRYYVNIAWVLRKDDRQEQLMDLASRVNEKISNTGRIPLLVEELNKVPHSGIPVYFQGNIALSNVYYIDFKDHFEIEQGVAFKDGNTVKLVFDYKDAAKAQRIFTQVHEFIETSKRFMDPGMIYQGFTCSDNKGNRLVFRLGDRFITVVVGPKTDAQLMPVQEEFFNQAENALRKPN